ncbi:hypothetical protein TRVA0_020S01882 [Trichomonascus vanleenenianus]|uniref:Pet127p n=1 Tax=Trichomonascus vanleenenianus TaxID=2268995 RepID=UPI003ECA4F73
MLSKRGLRSCLGGWRRCYSDDAGDIVPNPKEIFEKLQERKKTVKRSLDLKGKLASAKKRVQQPDLYSKLKLKQKSQYLDHNVLDSMYLSYEPVPVANQPPVPRLAHNLDRVLFSPGIHFLKDPRTNVYNFTPYLENIMSIQDFDFDYIAKYVPSGKDSTLAKLAQEKNKKFVGSTSSLTGVLSKFHQVLSHMRPPRTVELSKYFPGLTTTFTQAQLRPVSIFLRHNPETKTYSVDADKAENQDIILSILGNCLETMLTTPEKEFQNYHKSLSHKLPEETKSKNQNVYHYTACGSFLMRSQLDCFDERLPGTGVFDLKTRAVCAVRHDLDYVQIHDGSDYQIKSLDGEWESFNREWFELIRSTMMKYSLQARIGRMDGIFVAFHNVRQMFGFRYVPLSEMDRILHSARAKTLKEEKATIEKESKKTSPELDSLPFLSTAKKGSRATGLTTKVTQAQADENATHLADTEFTLSVGLLQRVLNQIIDSIHNNTTEANGAPPSYNIVFQAREAGAMTVIVKPMLEKHVEYIQNSGTEPKTAVASTDNYKPFEDPHTIWKHAETDGSFLPPDVTVYTLTTKSFIDSDEPLAPSEYPLFAKKNSRWRVKWRMSKARNSRDIYSSTFEDQPYVLREITSKPQLERMDTEEQSEYRMKALESLEPPSALQYKLRQLSKTNVGSEPSGPKIVWFPKPLDLVDSDVVSRGKND